MTKYVGVSPFQTHGFVWSPPSPGMVLTPNGVRLILAKPTFSFAYDNLYCEPTLCHRVVVDEEFALDADQISEVQQFITDQLALPLIVNGVDSYGRYLSDVPEDQVVRIVSNPPPTSGTWRFDFVRAAEYPGDHWKQAVCVDADGRYIGNVAEGEWSALADDLPPPSYLGEDWRWQGGQWVDARPLGERLSSAHALIKSQAWSECVARLEQASATATVGGVEYAYGCDAETRENIIGLNAAISVGVPIPNPRPYWPKGYIGETGVPHSHADFAAIGGALLFRKDQFVQAYLAHKTAILALTTPEDVLTYDLNTGWPA